MRYDPRNAFRVTWVTSELIVLIRGRRLPRDVNQGLDELVSSAHRSNPSTAQFRAQTLNGKEPEGNEFGLRSNRRRAGVRSRNTMAPPVSVIPGLGSDGLGLDRTGFAGDSSTAAC